MVLVAVFIECFDSKDDFLLNFFLDFFLLFFLIP